MASENQIDTLIKQLSNKDGQAREKARLTLVDIGKEATLPADQNPDRQRPANTLGSC